VRLVPCSANSRHKSVIPTGAKRSGVSGLGSRDRAQATGEGSQLTGKCVRRTPVRLVSCSANSRHKSVIPTGAKRSGGTLCFQRPVFFTQDFPHAIYFWGITLASRPQITGSPQRKPQLQSRRFSDLLPTGNPPLSGEH